MQLFRFIEKLGKKYEGFLDIINALLAMDNPPLVFTTSYGFDTEASLSESLTVYVFPLNT